MMKVAFAALTLASVVFAQNTTSTSASSSSTQASSAQASSGSASSATTSTAPSSAASVTPQVSGIPSGTSQGCATYLGQLNDDATVNSCLTGLIGATSAFDPSTSGNSTAANSTAIASAMSTLCSSSFTACPAASIRATLTDFYTHCSTDLLGTNGDGSDGNSGVIKLYDVLYLILPLKEAVCTKVNGKYCVTQHTATSSSSGSSPSATQAKRDSGLVASDLFERTIPSLVGRADNTTQETLGQVSPSADSYRNSGLPYLFLKPDSSDICSDCTFAVMSAYIRFETVTPYAIGIAHSPMLKGQLDLWEKIKTCPDNFASRLLNNSTGAAAPSSGASRTMALGTSMVGLLSVVGAAAVLL